MSWFNRLSLDGKHAAGEVDRTDVGGVRHRDIAIDGRTVASDGIQPVPFDEHGDVWLFSSTIAPELWTVRRSDIPNHLEMPELYARLPYSVNGLDANGNGCWVAWAAGQRGYPEGLVRAWDGREWPGYGAPTIAPDGRITMAKDGIVYDVKPREEDTLLPVLVGYGRTPRATDGGLAWILESEPHRPHVEPVADWGHIPDAHWAVPVLTDVDAPDHQWVLVLEADPALAAKRVEAWKASGGAEVRSMRAYYGQSLHGDRLTFRRHLASNKGYVAATGITHCPDARRVSRNRVRCCWTNADGSTGERILDLREPRVDLT